MSATCPTCGPRQDSDLEPLPFRPAYFALLKDWRTWAAAIAMMAFSGLLVGVLRLPSASAGAGGGVAIAFYMMSRLGRVRRCRTCGATIQA
ncbi:MAG: hypothetical protein U0326_21750 [Polyangiales bacterium]